MYNTFISFENDTLNKYQREEQELDMLERAEYEVGGASYILESRADIATNLEMARDTSSYTSMLGVAPCLR